MVFFLNLYISYLFDSGMDEESYTKIFKSIDSIIFDRGNLYTEIKTFCKAGQLLKSLTQTISAKKKFVFYYNNITNNE